jgi:hypothetical protein
MTYSLEARSDSLGWPYCSTACTGKRPSTSQYDPAVPPVARLTTIMHEVGRSADNGAEGATTSRE